MEFNIVLAVIYIVATLVFTVLCLFLAPSYGYSLKFFVLTLISMIGMVIPIMIVSVEFRNIVFFVLFLITWYFGHSIFFHVFVKIKNKLLRIIKFIKYL